MCDIKIDDYIDSSAPLSHEASSLARIESEVRAFGGLPAVLDLEKVNELESASEISSALGYLIKRISGE